MYLHHVCALSMEVRSSSRFLGTEVTEDCEVALALWSVPYFETGFLTEPVAHKHGCLFLFVNHKHPVVFPVLRVWVCATTASSSYAFLACRLGPLCLGSEHIAE